MKVFKSVCNTIIKVLNCILPVKWKIPKLAKTGMVQYPVIEHPYCRCVFMPYVPEEEGGAVE